jgi:DNA relaxase NicK
MARFDWYAATVHSPVVELSAGLLEALGGEWRDGRPRQGYGRCRELHSDGGQVLEMLYGGQHEEPHVVSTGPNAHAVAAALRQVAPRHSVARADVCEDVVAPGWFDQAFGVALEVARECRVRPFRAGDWDSDSPARTLYLGSPSSAVRVRLYEKGAEMRQKLGVMAREIPAEWTRLEVQVRPSKGVQKRMFSMVDDPLQWFGASRYSQRLAERLLGVDPPRLPAGTQYRAENLERAEWFLVRQYGRLIDRLVELSGSPEAFGRRLVAMRERARKV